MIPFPRARARLARLEPRWIVAALVLIAGLWLLHWSLRTHSFQRDEDLYVYSGRWLVANFPGGLTDFDFLGRGLQRLEVWQIAFWQWALPASPATLIAARATNVAAFATTAIPVYLLAAGLGARRAMALLAAAMSIVMPFAVVSTSFLTESLAYPACTWVIWAAWRAAVTPSWSGDLRVLVLVLVAGLSRTALLLLAIVPILTVAAHDLRPSAWSAARLRERVPATARAHPLLWSLTVLGALALLLHEAGADPTGGLIDRLAGSYGTPFQIDVSILAEKSARLTSRVVVGTGFLPALVAVPWLVTQLVRPREARSHAAAAAMVATTLAVLYSLLTAGPDERYILYLVPVVLVPAAVVASRLDVRPWAVAATGVLVGLLLLRTPWPDRTNDYDFFSFPVGMFYRRALGGRLDEFLPGGMGTVQTIVPLLVVLAGVALAATLPRRRALAPDGVGKAIVAVVAAIVVIQTQYVMNEYVNNAGNGTGPSLAARAWIDRTAPGGGAVGILALGEANTHGYQPIWDEAEFYNDRLSVTATEGDPKIDVKPPDRPAVAQIDRSTGRVRANGLLPRYLVTGTDAGMPQLRGRTVGAAGYAALRLVDAAQPLRLAWLGLGLSPSGWTPADGTARVRIFGRGLAAGRSHCATLALIAPPDATVRYTVRAGGVQRRGTVAATTQRGILVPLPGLAGRDHLDVKIRVAGGGTSPEGRGGVRLAGVTVDDGCAATR